MEKPEPYNPLNKRNLGKSVADALLEQPVGPLPPEKPFIGAGIYAIYYSGSFKHYGPIAARNAGDKYTCPIYVGKAVPAGARKGNVGLDTSPGQVLYSRLREHADTIKEATSLSLSDFRCRYLTVEDIWIPLGESLLINMFAPLWNMALDGFGNHDPGSGRYNQQNSLWDILHPGRKWATKLKPGRAQAEVIAVIKAHLEKMTR